jgi:uncharacterized protein (DUF427 family)
MSLTFGRAPLAQPGDRGEFDGVIPEHIRYWETWPRRMRAVIRGRTVLDSTRGVMLHETGKFTLLYFPLEDFDQEALEAGSEEEGVRRWSLRVGEGRFEDSVSASPAGEDGAELLPDHASLDFKTPDRWFEEDDPIYAHTRDPYHRVDVRSSSRAVEVRLGDQLVAASSRPKLLFETSNPVRYYLPFDDVRIEFLELSETISECPYKGDGQHWHLRVGGHEVRDAAWSLPHPLPEGIAATEHICFYPKKVELTVDGDRVLE